MRRTTALASAVLLALCAAPLAAQNDLPPSATAPIPTSRLVVTFEVSAALVSNKLPGEYASAFSQPLLDELAADENFSGIDLGTREGNGVSVRFDFADMASYQEWSDLPETQQLLAELRQAIGYGYSRTSLSMRRVPNDARHAMPTAPRRAPAAPATPGGKATTSARNT